MAKLIFSLENTILNEFQLSKERTSIGRRPSNDIQIDNLAVSGEHAVILKVGDNYYIEDQDSTNGTEVNAKLVKSHLLQAGDLIEFGKHQLKFVSDPKVKEAASNDGGFEKTIMMRPSDFKHLLQTPDVTGQVVTTENQVVENQPSQSSTGELSSVEQQAASDQVLPDQTVPNQSVPDQSVNSVSEKPLAIGRVQVLNGSSVGRELVLNKALTTLGKTGVQVAVITKRPQGYFITHVEGKVFPAINGTSAGAQAYALRDHDVIEIAGIKMEFYLEKL